MIKRFYIADLHYDHSNILNFKKSCGNPLRVFNDLEHMQTTILYNWNKVVGDQDKVYVLGDVTMGSKPKSLEFLSMLKGHKILIKGNHDQARLIDYQKHFQDIRAYDRKQGIICSHIPMHPDSLARFGVNIHGHLHDGCVKLPNGEIDKRYFNVSVERIEYTPIEYNELLERIKL